MKTRHAALQRKIVAECTVTVYLAEVRKEASDEVHGIGPLRVPGEFCLSPSLGYRTCCRLQLLQFFCCLLCRELLLFHLHPSIAPVFHNLFTKLSLIVQERQAS